MKTFLICLFLATSLSAEDLTGAPCHDCDDKPEHMLLASIGLNISDSFAKRFEFTERNVSGYCASFLGGKRVLDFYAKRRKLNDEDLRTIYEIIYCRTQHKPVQTIRWGDDDKVREIVAMMAELGIDPNIPDRNGYTLLDYAISVKSPSLHPDVTREHQETIKEIVEIYNAKSGGKFIPRYACELANDPVRRCSPTFNIDNGKVEMIYMPTRDQWLDGTRAYREQNKESIELKASFIKGQQKV